jgi:predicted LPLAT superfamily acyltransferase
VRTGKARYETVALPLFEGGRVPRRERERVARELVEGYVAELERWCLRAPYQWFNFYDFWA